MKKNIEFIQAHTLEQIVIKEKAENDHLFFSRYFFKHRQNIKFIVNWHHRLICDVIEDIFEGRKKNVVITVSPGSSKTELVIINFIARGLAINPHARFLHLSYSDDLASLNSQSARNLITSDEYQELWPIKISDDTKSKKRWNVLVDGKLAGGVYATSIAGQITGFRAGHMSEGFNGCFVGETKIITKCGLKSIDEITPNDLVLSFNHDANRHEYKRVRATKISIRTDIVQVETTEGRSFRCTPCHRFFDGSSYRTISSFAAGDSLKVLSHETLAQVHELSGMFSKRTPRSSSRNDTWSDLYILFQRLFKLARQEDKKVNQASRDFLFNLFKRFQASKSNVSNMFLSMCECSPFEKNERNWKLQFQSRFKSLRHCVRKNETLDKKKRRRLLFDLWFSKEINGTSYGSQQRQQFASEFSDSLSKLPHHLPQIESESISRITRLSESETKVYDIQVEGNHNFFANGVLAHNCILMDDLLKPEDGFSRSKVNLANRKLLTTIKSRKANPDTPIILIMQRIAENDPVGFIKNGNVPGKWDFITIPAIIDDAYVKNLDLKYQSIIPKAETDRFSYWPYKERLEELLSMERGDGIDQTGGRISRHVFASQYQQNPVAIGGNIIKGEWFKRYKVLPPLTYRNIYADTAQKTKERNDFSVFQCWGRGSDGKIYLIDQLRGKWESPELKSRAIAFWIKHKDMKSDVSIGQLRKLKVEDKSSGTDIIQTLRQVNEIPVEGIERNKDKLTRVMDASPYIESGMVCIPEAAQFVNDYLTECEGFSADDTHAHDDQIDPTCDAIADMISTTNKLKVWEKLGKG